MIKTMKKSLVLAVAVAAMSAIAVPSMASANNWGPVNTYHNLSSPSSLTFDLQGGSPGGFSCSSGPTFAALVRTPASSLMDLTSTTTNVSCTGTGGFAACNVALSMIGLPVWSVDGTSTTNVKINSVNIDATFTPKPGQFCGAAGITAKVSGQLAGGVWSNLNRSLAYTNGTGLNITFPPGGAGNTFPITLTASEFIKDTTSPFLSL